MPEILGLADIDYHSPRITHQVAPRPIGHGFETLFENVGQERALLLFQRSINGFVAVSRAIVVTGP
jgi:hypothetical protein